jgi:hypothetical protein
VSARTGRPLGRDDAFLAVRDTTWVVFDGLGVLGTWRDRDAPPTPFAVALARAALLHEDPPAPAKVVPAVELAVSLRDVDPPVWRRLLVPERATLRDLTGLLQAAMGWQGAHLSMFELDGRPYGDVEDTVDLGDPRLVRIGSLDEGTAFRWDYDFGDGWEHDVRVGAHRTAEARPPVWTAPERARPRTAEARMATRGSSRCLPTRAIPSTRTPSTGWAGGSIPSASIPSRPPDACYSHTATALSRGSKDLWTSP